MKLGTAAGEAFCQSCTQVARAILYLFELYLFGRVEGKSDGGVESGSVLTGEVSELSAAAGISIRQRYQDLLLVQLLRIVSYHPSLPVTSSLVPQCSARPVSPPLLVSFTSSCLTPTPPRSNACSSGYRSLHQTLGPVTCSSPTPYRIVTTPSLLDTPDLL